jgi:phosphatidylglycerophosphate synthase
MARQLRTITTWRRTPGALPGMLTSAVAVAVLGGLLIQLADWQALQVATALVGYAVLAAAVVLAAAWHLGGMNFGLANQVTLLRTGLACLVASALLVGDGAHLSWSVAAVVGLALSLDAVDGWLARRLGLASAFGARFDLEIDALMILILALLVWLSGRAGIWALAIGAMRYVFVALAMIWPPARQPLPPSWRRKAVCALIGVLLLIAILPPVPAWLAGAATALALLSQLASFGSDVAWQAGSRGRHGAEPA